MTVTVGTMFTLTQTAAAATAALSSIVPVPPATPAPAPQPVGAEAPQPLSSEWHPLDPVQEIGEQLQGAIPTAPQVHIGEHGEIIVQR